MIQYLKVVRDYYEHKAAARRTNKSYVRIIRG